jgi:zinc protease
MQMNVKASANGSPVVRRTLDNGLTVIVRPKHEAPIGSFWVWYRVGARNEVPGITGISHWAEHMLFKGTEAVPAGEIFRRVSAAGGSLNGFTWIDYTTYFETLPIDRIDLALEIESDRMTRARFDAEEVASERSVIISERQGNENQPTFFLREEVSAAAFRAHTYGQGVIGYLSDLQAITRDDLYRHYQTYYRPNNAVAVLAGNIEPDAAIEKIERFFGEIEPSPHIPSVRTVEPEPQGERRVTINRPAPNRVMLMAYLAPPANNPDIAALTVLDAVLSGGKPFSFSGAGGTIGRSSRFYRRFVSTGLAAGAGTSLSLSIDPYLFSVSATLNPETDQDDFERQISEEMARLQDEALDERELARAIRQLRAQWAYAQESVTSQAYWLGSLALVAPERDPDTFIDEIEAVTAADVQRVAQTYLTARRRTVGWLIPN